MKSLSQHLFSHFENIFQRKDIHLVSDPVSVYTKDTNFLLLLDFNQIGTLVIRQIEKKSETKIKGISVRLDICFGPANRVFFIDYFPNENGPMLSSLFTTLENELNLWFS